MTVRRAETRPLGACTRLPPGLVGAQTFHLSDRRAPVVRTVALSGAALHEWCGPQMALDASTCTCS